MQLNDIEQIIKTTDKQNLVLKKMLKYENCPFELH